MRKIALNIMISLCSVFITIGICELIARLVLSPPMVVQIEDRTRTPSTESAQSTEEVGTINSVLDWSGQFGIRLNPNVTAAIRNHSVSEQDIELRTNSLGLRYKEIGEKKEGEKRVLLIGDSITLGDYVQEADTYPGILERLLREEDPNIAAINAGLPGASLRDEYYHYLELRDHLKPDLIIVGMYLNDAQNSQKFYSRRLRFPFSESRLLTWAVQRFNLIDTSRLFGLRSPDEIDPQWKEEFRAGRDLKNGHQLESRIGFDFEIYNASNDFGLGWNPKAWDNLSTIMETFREAVKQSASHLGVILFPARMQVYATEEANSLYPQEQFSKMCKRLGLNCLDLQPVLRAGIKEYPDHQDLYFDHCHLKQPGNQMVAKALKQWILENNLLKLEN